MTNHRALGLAFALALVPQIAILGVYFWANGGTFAWVESVDCIGTCGRPAGVLERLAPALQSVEFLLLPGLDLASDVPRALGLPHPIREWLGMLPAIVFNTFVQGTGLFLLYLAGGRLQEALQAYGRGTRGITFR